MNLYDIAREVTDKVLGEGSYAEINRSNPNPGVQAAIKKWNEQIDSDLATWMGKKPE